MYCCKNILSLSKIKQKSLQPFHDGGRYHIETSPLICSAKDQDQEFLRARFRIFLHDSKILDSGSSMTSSFMNFDRFPSNNFLNLLYSIENIWLVVCKSITNLLKS